MLKLYQKLSQTQTYTHTNKDEDKFSQLIIIKNLLLVMLKRQIILEYIFFTHLSLPETFSSIKIKINTKKILIRTSILPTPFAHKHDTFFRFRISFFWRISIEYILEKYIQKFQNKKKNYVFPFHNIIKNTVIQHHYYYSTTREGK